MGGAKIICIEHGVFIEVVMMVQLVPKGTGLCKQLKLLLCSWEYRLSIYIPSM